MEFPRTTETDRDSRSLMDLKQVLLGIGTEVSGGVAFGLFLSMVGYIVLKIMH